MTLPTDGAWKKPMKRRLSISVLLLAGCGSNLSGGVTLADARAVCLSADDGPEAPALFDAFVLVAEAGRDQGTTQGDFLATFLPACDEANDPTGCFTCLTNMAAAVWP